MLPAISISNLSVTYEDARFPAVENVSFEVAANSISMLVGPNGAGKTTIMRAILGLTAYQGVVKIFGKSVSEVRELLGFVPQRASFDATFPITVSEFISLSLTEKGGLKKKLIEEALGKIKAQDLAKRPLFSLSGGQLQRILLARALIKNPKLLILDEPEAGVDVGGEQTFYDLLDNLVEKGGVTALIASHELDVVYTYADFVLCVNKKLLCQGAPREVLNQETFEELYGRGLRFYAHNHKNGKLT